MPRSSADSPPPISCLVCGGTADHLYHKRQHQVFRCRDCGLGVVDPLPSAEELERFYANTYYESDHEWGYHTEYGELEAGLRKMYRRFLRRIEALYPGQRFDRVIDVGCAYGFFLDAVEERWKPEHLVGVDVTPESKEHNSARGREFHAGFFEQVELPEDHFGLAFMGDAFEHVHDPIAVVEKFARILAPGGVVVITTVDFDSWLARILGSRWRLMNPPEHLFFWTRRSISRLFADHGFETRVENYWLYYPKSYVHQRTRAQFGLTPRFIDLLPGDVVPIPSFDVLMGIFRKRE